jgi:hypothetical protein
MSAFEAKRTFKDAGALAASVANDAKQSLAGSEPRSAAASRRALAGYPLDGTAAPKFGAEHFRSASRTLGLRNGRPSLR